MVAFKIRSASRWSVVCLTLVIGAELLAAQSQYDSGDPTADEQYVLEIINRARANPTAEGVRLGIDINEGLSTNAVVRPPLAMSSILLGTARAHSQDMYTRKYFEHTDPDGKSPFDRIDGAGYDGIAEGENIAASSSASAASLEDLLMIDKGEPGRGHRVNLLNVGSSVVYREIGIGYYSGATPVSGSSQQGVDGLKDFITQDFGTNSKGPFVLGVVYNDTNQNNFYDPGEGIAGVTITPDSGTYFAVTGTAGGYAIPVGTSGTLTLTASGGSLSQPMTAHVTLTGSNVKVDFVPGRVVGTPPAITSPLTAAGMVNANFTYTITASGTAPATFSASGMPVGLSLSGDTITGMPQQSGTFNVTLTAANALGKDTQTLVLTIGGSVSNTTIDTDGDGFPDEIEIALGTSPTDSSSTPFGGAPAHSQQSFSPAKLQIKLNFAKANNDSLTVSGTLPLAAGFAPSGQSMTVDVGGVIRTFALDGKGKSVLPAGETLKLRFKTVKGAVPAQFAPFTVAIARSALAASLTDEGLLNASIKSPVTVPAIILFTNAKFALNFTATYAAQLHKTGMVKAAIK